MKDIDFDELDRAVSSVLGKTVEKTDVSQGALVVEDRPPVEHVAPVAAAVPPVVSQDETVAAPAVEVRSSAAPLAVKRRGKFMDVMHPSADMNPSTGASSFAKPRVAPVVAPLPVAETSPHSTSSSEPTAALDESQTLIGAEPTPIDDALPISDDQVQPLSGGVSDSDDADSSASLFSANAPDPLSFNAQTSKSEAADGSDTLIEATNEPKDDGAALQITPFLADTQVQKRPLGAFGDADAVDQQQPLSTSNSSADGSSSPAPLPRELQPDVVEVESVQAADSQDTVASSQSGPFAAKVGVAPDEDDGRVEGHPLFDTSTYHEPIAPVHHKTMPGWVKWLLGLLLCLAVGAGVGYFLFTAGL